MAGLHAAPRALLQVSKHIRHNPTLHPSDNAAQLSHTTPRLPPNTNHHSIRSYLAYRFLPAAEGEALYNVTGLMPAAELGDPLNNLVIKTTGGPGNPFCKTTLVVSTGDQATFRRLREAFGAAGFPEAAMNLDVLPAEKLAFRHAHRPWILDQSDTIAWQFRVNVCAMVWMHHTSLVGWVVGWFKTDRPISFFSPILHATTGVHQPRRRPRVPGQELARLPPPGQGRALRARPAAAAGAHAPDAGHGPERGVAARAPRAA